MNPLDDIPPMGFLAEDACRRLAIVITDVTQRAPAREKNERLVKALRQFMHEAKKGQNL